MIAVASDVQNLLLRKEFAHAAAQQVDYSTAPNFTIAKTVFNIIGTDGAVEYPANVRYETPRLKRNGKNH